MEEDIKQRRHAEWLRRRGAGDGASAKNGRPSDAAEQILLTEVGPPTKRGSRKRARIEEMEKKEEAEPARETKRAKSAEGAFELAAFGEVQDDQFTVVSWNLDGLTDLDLVDRVMFFIDMMKKRKPGVIMLQEITDVTHPIIVKFLGAPYHVLTPPAKTPAGVDRFPYYTCLLLSKFHWNLIGDPTCQWFGDSRMGRHVLWQRVVGKNLTDGEHEFVFGTTHLESLKEAEFSRRRTVQFGEVFAAMRAFVEAADAGEKPFPCAVLIGGDFNARQNEVDKAIKGYENAVLDVWEMLGAPKQEQWTWDMFVNDNLSKADGGGRMNVHTRFDRMYFMKSDLCRFKPTEFKLIGRQRIGLGSNLFVSDHWGMAATMAA